MAPGLTHLLISVRCLFMASMLTVGMTNAAPVPPAGQMAQRLAQMRVSVPCWPTRAHPQPRFQPAGRQAAAGSRRVPARRSFFKSLLRLKVGLRVHRTHRDAAEIQLLQKLADAALMQMNIEFGGDAVTQVGTAPAYHAVGLGIRAVFRPLRHLAQLGFG